MGVKEKLVERLHKATEYAVDFCLDHCCEDCPGSKYGIDCRDYILADHLIANGITVQGSGGCEYCEEDNEGCRKVNGAYRITNPFHGGEWFLDTGHCKPRQIFFCPMCGRRLPNRRKGGNHG